MDEIVAAMAAQQDELSALLEGRTDEEWALPSSCEGWSAYDVVLHMAQTNELTIASVQGELPEVAQDLGAGDGRESSVDDHADLMVQAQRGAPVAELHERWLTGVDKLRAVIGAADPHERVMWVSGLLSVRTLTTTRLAETWIHTNDVADAFGVTLVPADRLRYVARLAWRTLPYAFAGAGTELHGPVAFELRGPSGDEWSFDPNEEAATVITGDGVELCLVAARRLDPKDTSLVGNGPDATAVLELVRTYA